MKNHEADAMGIRARRTQSTVTELVVGVEPAAPPHPATGAETPPAGQDAPEATDPAVDPSA